MFLDMIGGLKLAEAPNQHPTEDLPHNPEMAEGPHVLDDLNLSPFGYSSCLGCICMYTHDYYVVM